MTGLRRPDEVVVGDAESVPLGPEGRGVPVGEHPRGLACLLSCLGDLVAMLVGACEEVDVAAGEAPVAAHRVGDDGRVGVAEMGPRVDVVDRRGEVERLTGRLGAGHGRERAAPGASAPGPGAREGAGHAAAPPR